LSTFFLNAGGLAVIAGVSLFFWIVVGLAVAGGVGVLLRLPWPLKGLGVGLIVGAVIIAGVLATGPTK
jgi:hypothetical protein